MTPLDLKERLGDVAQATLYRHLNRLTDGGVLEIVSERQVRGGVERTYCLVEGAASLSEADLATATTDDHFRYFATFLGTLLGDFAAYLENGDPQLGADGVGYRQIPLWLTDDEFTTLAGTIRDAIEAHLANEPTPQRRQRLLTTIVMPDDRVRPEPPEPRS